MSLPPCLVVTNTCESNETTVIDIREKYVNVRTFQIKFYVRAKELRFMAILLMRLFKSFSSTDEYLYV